jgi:hypothetical protein
LSVKTIDWNPLSGLRHNTRRICFRSRKFYAGIQINPLGLMVSAIILIAAGVLFYDLIFNQIVLEKILQLTQAALKNRIFLSSILFLISVNWFWNISKDL